jgi:hypothetical protein
VQLANALLGAGLVEAEEAEQVLEKYSEVGGVPLCALVTCCLLGGRGGGGAW